MRSVNFESYVELTPAQMDNMIINRYGECSVMSHMSDLNHLKIGNIMYYCDDFMR